MIDFIIVSDPKTPELKELQKQTMETAFTGGVSMVPNVVKSLIPFNYNKTLNYGAKSGTNPYIAFCNNDLIFSKDWAKILIEAMEKNGCESGSPWCPKAHGEEFRIKRDTIGWQPRKYFAGWCFVWTRELWERLGGLDETYSYWCSDNIASLQIQKAGVKHILVKDSICEHIGDQTGKLLTKEEKKEMTVVQAKKFEENTGQTLFPKKLYESWGL